MAQINLNTIKQIEKAHNFVHEKVQATYNAFELDGKRYVQIDTYGRNDRNNPEKISQSIQFDRETAQFMINCFIKEFGLLDTDQ